MEIKDLEINKALPVVPLSDEEMSKVTGGTSRTPTATPTPPESMPAPVRPRRRWRNIPV